jgi:hypothetical protein
MDRSGALDAAQVLTGSLEHFCLYTTIDITQTGDFKDTTQKDLEGVVQVIALRATPILLGRPQAHADLAAAGAPTLTGAGWSLKFGFEREGAHTVETLSSELGGIVLNGGVVQTTGSTNTEFKRFEEWT